MLANRWILLAAIPLFLALCAESYLSVRFALDEREQQGWVVHTYQVTATLQRILNDVQEAETGQRGYIITRQDRFLVPYRDGVAKAGRDLEDFRRLTEDNRRQQTRAGVLRELVASRFQSLDAVLARASAQMIASPAMLVAMDQGKARMDRLRSELARGIAEENGLLAARSAARHRIERNEVLATTLAAVVALFVILGTALLLVLSNVSLSRSRKKLANESAILQATLDTVRDGIAMFASDGELCAYNEAFFRILGFPASAARKGVRIDDLAAMDRVRGAPVFDEHYLRFDGRQDFRRVTVDEREIDLYRAPVATGGHVVVCIDVTDRLRAEQTARQAQKMEAVGHLTGGVAHDFNNLLQVIGTNLDHVARDAQDTPKSLERVRNALEAVARGARLTSQLLSFARRQMLDPRSTNVGRVVQDMTNLLRRTLGERVEIECVVAGGLWNTFIDPSQIESAILNLAINARDAMPDGGKLTIEVANAFLDDSYAAQHVEVMSGQYVMIGVSDTGAGMAPEVAARVFEPFFTTKPEGCGTGLGLSQVYGFVKQSGGHRKIYSEIGHGTTIKLYLPRTRRPEEGVAAVATNPIEGGSERILVVEDDAQVRAAAIDTLGELGYCVFKAENAEQALAILASGAAIDLLFTDVVMPGPISTRELARRAQELQPGIAVLYTSGYTQNAIVHNGRLDDGVHLLSKPYRREELAAKLRTMLAGRRGEAASPPQSPSKPAPPGTKVLVVEDIALIRMTTKEMVEEIGFTALEADDGDRALATLRSDPGVGVLLTDIGLPGMSGRELVDKALALKPDLKIIVVSGYKMQDGPERVSDRGTHLMKPFDIEQLRRALEA